MGEIEKRTQFGKYFATFFFYKDLTVFPFFYLFATGAFGPKYFVQKQPPLVRPIRPVTLLKKWLAQVFCEIFKNTVFYRTHTFASGGCLWLLVNLDFHISIRIRVKSWDSYYLNNFYFMYYLQNIPRSFQCLS